MSDDPKAARAEAKAAEARAKALRPWWKKKRTWLGAIIAVFILGGIAASTGGSDDEKTKADGDAKTGTTLGDEAGEDTDVTIGSCAKDEVGWTAITGTATNSSSKRSDYFFEIVVEDAAGTQVGTADGFVENVEPGQTANWEASTLADHVDGATCRLANVERNASL